MTDFAIAGRRIGPDQPPFLIAEAGVNHNGDPALAMRLVDAAADAGADAVKFQTFRAEALTTTRAPQAAYQRDRGGGGTQQEMLRKLELPTPALRAALGRAVERGIVGFSTPFDAESAALLVGLGVPALKIGSGDLTNAFLLQAVAGHGLPVILSTGMASLEEVDAAVAIIRASGSPPLALLHCLSAYPAPPQETNLRAISAMRRRYGCEVGFSDHTTGIPAPIAAVALGATIVEKHLTLDRSLPGPDHAASLEPEEFAHLALALGEAYSALGDGRKRPQPSEADVRMVARRSLVAARDLPEGTVLAASDLEAKRPANGISPLRLDEVIGRRLRRRLRRNALVHTTDFEPASGEGSA